MSGAQNQLPSDPTEAVKFTINIVDQLLEVMEEENRALMVKDSVAFTASQDQKVKLSERYQVISTEFKQRIMDFRSVDKALLDQLDAKQRELANKTKENMQTMENLQSNG